MSDTEWGPWIEHDGKGCPCVGEYIQAEFHTVTTGVSHGTLNGRLWEGVAKGLTSWVWDDGFDSIVRYRIRKSKGMKILEEIVSKPLETKIEEHA